MSSSTGALPGSSEVLEGLARVKDPPPEADGRQGVRGFIATHRGQRDAEPGRGGLRGQVRWFGLGRWGRRRRWQCHGRPDSELELLELPDDLRGPEALKPVRERVERGGEVEQRGGSVTHAPAGW